MLSLKNKYILRNLLFVIAFSLTFGIFLAPARTLAVNVTCPDGYKQNNVPQGEKDAICADHKTGGPEADSSGCYVNGVKSACPSSSIPGYDSSKCYSASASSGGVGPYSEVPCSPGLSSPGSGGAGSTTNSPSPQLGSFDAEVDKAFGGCDSNNATTSGDDENNACGFVEKYINPLINFLAALAGMAVVGMIILGGVQYSMAGGDPNKVAAAKSKIINAIIALISFFALFAVLQWLVPGGIF